VIPAESYMRRVPDHHWELTSANPDRTSSSKACQILK
jgi:hypothetical protein